MWSILCARTVSFVLCESIIFNCVLFAHHFEQNAKTHIILYYILFFWYSFFLSFFVSFCKLVIILILIIVVIQMCFFASSPSHSPLTKSLHVYVSVWQTVNDYCILILVHIIFIISSRRAAFFICTNRIQIHFHMYLYWRRSQKLTMLTQLILRLMNRFFFLHFFCFFFITSYQLIHSVYTNDGEKTKREKNNKHSPQQPLDYLYFYSFKSHLFDYIHTYIFITFVNWLNRMQFAV